MIEADLRRAILCERKAVLTSEGVTTDCPGECIAHLLGWSGMYATPLRSRHGWRTPTRGDLGQGWPDMTLVRPPRWGVASGRIIFAELKADDGQLSDAQRAVMATMMAAGLEVYVWRPRDLDDGTIWRTMQGGGARPSWPVQP